jgi:dTDP-4-amino-4,6-dideoxygalactose transaminase
MSEFMFDERQLSARPAVLDDGERVVILPDGMTVTGWSVTRWGFEPELSRRPRRGEVVWPSWPQFSDESIDHAVAILESQRDGGEGLPLGYLGPEEANLEKRYAEMIGSDDQGREPKVFAARDGSLALIISYLALMTKRYVIDGMPTPAVPTAATSVRSFEATWTGLMKAGLKPAFVDVDRATGCATAAALDTAIDDSTALLSVPLLYDRSPDVEECRELANRRGVGFLLDGAHAHMAMWNGVHVAKLVDIYIVSGQGSKIVTPGSEYAFIVVFDPTLAALVAQIRNVGRGLSPKPAWWPHNLPVTAGENGRNGELNAVLMGGSFDSYAELQHNRVHTLRELQNRLNQSRGPWRTLPAQDELTGVMYKGTLIWDPDNSDNPRAWTQIGWAAAGRLLAEELVTEIAASYPPPWEAASEYHPTSRPWAWEQLVPETDPANFPIATYFSEHAHMLPHEFLARDLSAEQVLTAAAKLNRWVDHPEVQSRARTHNA